MRRSDKIRIGRDPEGVGREEPGSYRGEGIWSWCHESNTARELPRTEDFADTLKWVGAGYHASLPRLYRDFGLSENGGAWEVFPDHGLFKVTTVSGRSWFAEYGLVASWNHETHSWLWAWAFPRDWQGPPSNAAADHGRGPDLCRGPRDGLGAAGRAVAAGQRTRGLGADGAGRACLGAAADLPRAGERGEHALLRHVDAGLGQLTKRRGAR